MFTMLDTQEMYDQLFPKGSRFYSPTAGEDTLFWIARPRFFTEDGKSFVTVSPAGQDRSVDYVYSEAEVVDGALYLKEARPFGSPIQPVSLRFDRPEGAPTEDLQRVIDSDMESAS